MKPEEWFTCIYKHKKLMLVIKNISSSSILVDTPAINMYSNRTVHSNKNTHTQLHTMIEGVFIHPPLQKTALFVLNISKISKMLTVGTLIYVICYWKALARLYENWYGINVCCLCKSLGEFNMIGLLYN